jgi:hypothetical protein
VRVAGKEIDWFFPLHGYDAGQRASKVAAAIREAELLGVVAGDVVSGLGEHLRATAGVGCDAHPGHEDAGWVRRWVGVRESRGVRWGWSR